MSFWCTCQPCTIYIDTMPPISLCVYLFLLLLLRLLFVTLLLPYKINTYSFRHFSPALLTALIDRFASIFFFVFCSLTIPINEFYWTIFVCCSITKLRYNNNTNTHTKRQASNWDKISENALHRNYTLIKLCAAVNKRKTNMDLNHKAIWAIK